MNPVEIEKTNFNCPKCKSPALKVVIRGGNPIAYHCADCKEKLKASWTLLGDEISEGILEQAIDSDEKVHDLGQFGAGQ